MGASGDLAPWLGLLWPFGLSVPSAARQRCNDIGYSFANNSGTKWSWCCVDAYWNEWASYSITPTAKCEEYARWAHAALQARWPERARHIPLVRLDPWNWNAPFVRQ